MRALLINPPTGRYMRADRCQTPVDTRVAEPPRPPMDLAYMAAVLEGMGVECRIRDYPMEGLGQNDIIADLKNFMPDMFVISTTTPTIEKDLIVCDLAKKINPNVKTVAKGAHFLVFDKKILAKFNSLDVAMRGEVEITIREIADGKNYADILGITFKKDSEIIRNPDRPFFEPLDELPFPARHLLNNELYRTPDTDEPIAYVVTGRGCPVGCIFCAAGIVSGKKVRMRSVESVIREVGVCVEKFGIKNFFFGADTFTWHKEWVIDFCRQILNKNLKIRWGVNSRADMLDEERVSWMKRAGCYVIGLGAESGSQYILDKIGKGITLSQIEDSVNLCRRHGVQSFLIFVIGLPWETKETIDDTIRFIKKTLAAFIEVNVAYPLPGTEFYNIAKKNGLFDEKELSGHNQSSPLVRSFAISTEELSKLRKKILREFYIRPSYIAKRICSVKSPRVVLNYCKYGIRLIKNLLLN